MRLAVVVEAHRDPEQVDLLLAALEHPQVTVYLHWDRDAPDFTPATDVVRLPRHRGRWGGAGILDAGLDGLRSALADGCDYFTLISGQDFPLRPMGAIVDFLDGAPSAIEHWPTHTSVHRFHGRDRTDFYSYWVRGKRIPAIPFGEDTSHLNLRGKVLNHALRARTLVRPRRRFPSYAQPYTGVAWWNLTREAAEYVTAFVERHPDFRPWFEDAWIPDEFFMHSILAGSGYRGELVNDSWRYIEHGSGYHPKTLSVDDLGAMLASGKLFARKFDAAVDREVLDQLSAIVRVTDPGSRASARAPGTGAA